MSEDDDRALAGRGPRGAWLRAIGGSGLPAELHVLCSAHEPARLSPALSVPVGSTIDVSFPVLTWKRPSSFSEWNCTVVRPSRYMLAWGQHGSRHPDAAPRG